MNAQMVDMTLAAAVAAETLARRSMAARTQTAYVYSQKEAKEEEEEAIVAAAIAEMAKGMAQAEAAAQDKAPGVQEVSLYGVSDQLRAMTRVLLLGTR